MKKNTSVLNQPDYLDALEFDDSDLLRRSEHVAIERTASKASQGDKMSWFPNK